MKRGNEMKEIDDLAGWPVVIRLDAFVDLLRAAGYGGES